MLSAAVLAFFAWGGEAARADCVPNNPVSNNTVNCASPGTAGLTAGAGVDNLTVNIQTNASVVSAGDGIRVRAGNTVTNNGAIQAGTNGIRGDNNNTVVNNGTINVDANGNGIQLNNNTSLSQTPNLTNNGSISVGDGGTGIFVNSNHNILNAGTITAGANGFGIVVDTSNIVTNNGTISVGAGGIGVQLVDPDNTLNNYGTIRAVGSGLSLDVCGCATGSFILNRGTLDGHINVDGSNNTITNSGLITLTDPATPIRESGRTFVVWNQSFFGSANTFIQTSQGTLALRMDNLGLIDNLIADKFSLAGALKVVIQPQLYQQQTFSSGSAIIATTFGAGAGNTITSTFQNFVASSPFFRVTPIYDTLDPTAYFTLDVQLDRIPFGSVPGSTRNQQAVGNALDPFYSTTLTGNAATLFSNLLAATSLSVLDQLSGQGTAALGTASLNAGSLFNNAALNQLVFGDAAGGASVIIPPAQYAATPRPRGQDAFASALKATAAPATQTGRWRIWTLGFGGYRSVDGNAFPIGSASQTMRNYGGAMGFDYQVSPDLLLGFAAGGSEANISVPSLTTTGQLSGGHVGFYGLKTWGSYYAAASASYARFNNTTSRGIVGIGTSETVTGIFDSDQLSARLELGWRRAFANFAVMPFVAVEPAALWSRSYTEAGTGILGLSFASRTTTSLPTFLGVQIDSRTVFGNGSAFSPYARASWVHEFEPARQVRATFITIPTATFTVDGARPASDAARIDAGAKFEFDRRHSFFANLSGEWSNAGQSYTASAGLKFIR